MHACPVCSARIREVRAREVEQGLKVHFERGGAAVFVTLTAPHDTGDRLDRLWDAIAKGLQGVWSGRASAKDRTDLGIVGVIRALEVTHGMSGWHPHVHAIILTDKPLQPGEQAYLLSRLQERWSRAIVRAGLRSPSTSRGITLFPITTIEAIASYATKITDEYGTSRTVGRELTRIDQKQGRWFGSRTPFQILVDLFEQGDAQDLALWREWEGASFGRKAIVWSRGLRRELGVDEVSDEEIVAEEVGGVTVAVLAPSDWRAVSRAGMEWDLVVAAPDGASAVAEVLARANASPCPAYRRVVAGRAGWKALRRE